MSDAPLTDPSEDALGRHEVATRLANSLMNIDAKDGFVLALDGPWGSGKTTLANFIKYELDNREGTKPIIVHFNPWWFGSSEDLLNRFLMEFSAAIGRQSASKKLRRIAATLDLMAKVASPLRLIPVASETARTVSEAGKGMSDAVSSLAAQMDNDMYGLREEVTKRLRMERRRVVVFVDDLDRLDAAEIKRMFAVIKAVANFPNTIYVLALDRTQAATVLDAVTNSAGAAYVEKIVQATVNVPLPSRAQIQGMMERGLSAIVGELEKGSTDYEHLGVVWLEVLWPFLRQPRQIVRYLNSLQLADSAIGSEVNRIDLLAVEFLHVFAPDTYEFVRSNARLFAGYETEEYALGDLRDNAKRKEVYEQVLGLIDTSLQEGVRKALLFLFPRFASCYGGGVQWSDPNSWLRERRCCCPPVFQAFFSAAIPEGFLSSADRQLLIDSTNDAAGFEGELRRLASERHPSGQGNRLGDALEWLRTSTQDGFCPGSNPAAVLGLTNIIGSIEMTTESFMGGLPMTEWVVWGLVKQVLRREQDPAELLAKVAAETTSLYGIAFWLSSVQMMEEEQSTELSDRRLALSEDDFNKVKDEVVRRLRCAAETLPEHKKYVFLIDSWLLWDEVGAREFANSILESNEALFRELKRFISPHLKDDTWGRSLVESRKHLRDIVGEASLDQRARHLLETDSGLDEEQIGLLRAVLAEDGESGSS